MDHTYELSVTWQGNRGSGTSGYREYGRQVLLSAAGKPDIEASADKPFHGDAERWNPEELLVAALSECHLLSYLHMCAANGVVVTAYDDRPVGTMAQAGIGDTSRGCCCGPASRSRTPPVELARSLHHDASQACFIASSENFPVEHEPEITT